MNDKTIKLIQDNALRYARELRVNLVMTRTRGGLYAQIEHLYKPHRDALLPLLLPNNRYIAILAYKQFKRFGLSIKAEKYLDDKLLGD